MNRKKQGKEKSFIEDGIPFPEIYCRLSNLKKSGNGSTSAEKALREYAYTYREEIREDKYPIRK